MRWLRPQCAEGPDDPPRCRLGQGESGLRNRRHRFRPRPRLTAPHWNRQSRMPASTSRLAEISVPADVSSMVTRPVGKRVAAPPEDVCVCQRHHEPHQVMGRNGDGADAVVNVRPGRGKEAEGQEGDEARCGGRRISAFGFQGSARGRAKHKLDARPEAHRRRHPGPSGLAWKYAPDDRQECRQFPTLQRSGKIPRLRACMEVRVRRCVERLHFLTPQRSGKLPRLKAPGSGRQ